jgi:phospholipid/cholesterol/gamma-HCH transport system substrate-binding protein
MEVTVGAFMFMILLALGFFTIVLSRENLFTPTYHFDVVFNEVKGLREGDNVFLRGVSVGKIKRLEIQPGGVQVRVNLEIPAELHQDYRVEILPSSVLGGRYLNIYEGSEILPLVEKGAVIRGVPPVDLIDEATRTTQLIKKALDEGGIIENLKATMTQLKEITTKLSAGEGTLGKLLVDDSVYTNVEEIVSNLRVVSERLNGGKGTIGKLLSEDDTLYQDLKDTVASLKTVSGAVSGGEGSLGKLVMNDELYQEVRVLLHEIQATVDDYRETVPIVTFTSILLGAF